MVGKGDCVLLYTSLNEDIVNLPSLLHSLCLPLSLPPSLSLSQETDRYLKETEDRERKNLNRVLLEERSWFCGFVNAFSRVLVS